MKAASFLRSKALSLSLAFTLLIAAAILCFSIALTLVLRRNVERRQEAELWAALNTLSREFSESGGAGGTVGFGGVGAAGGNFGSEGFIPYYISYLVYADGTGDILFTNDPFIPALPVANRPTRYVEKNFYIDGDLNLLYVTAPAAFTPGAGAVSVTMQVALNMDTDYGASLLSGLPTALLLLALPLVLVSFGAAFFITKATMRPVKTMTARAASLSANTLETPFTDRGTGDEFDTLAATFNALFSRLKADFDREKRFTADVSHELKTPIAVIKGHANLIRRWGRDDPEQLEKSLGRLLREADSMERLVENLLVLSRLDAGRLVPNLAPVDVHGLFARLVADTRAWAPAVRFVLAGGGGTTADSLSAAQSSGAGMPRESAARSGSRAAPKAAPALLCDGELVYEALTALVANSVRYAVPPAAPRRAPAPAQENAVQGDSRPAPKSSAACAPPEYAAQSSAAPQDSVTITLCYTPANSGAPATITVSDNGPGVTPEQLPHLFERFYRADCARTRTAAENTASGTLQQAQGTTKSAAASGSLRQAQGTVTSSGTGLGLSLVQGIMAAHGGTASAQNCAPTGLSVSLSFPASQSR